MKQIEVHLNEQSSPIVYTNVSNTYTKGYLYCVMYEIDGKRKVDKFPLMNIFRIREDY
jgi:hypothetical protein